MNKKIRLLSLALAGVMLAGVLGGCGNGSGSSTQSKESAASGGSSAGASAAETGTDPYADLPMELSVTTLDRGQVGASEGSYEQNRWVDWINENAPVKVTVVPVTRTESVAKINALFASGSAPDLVWEFGKTFMDNLYVQGVLQPVGDYIDQYSTQYKAYLEENPELMPYLLQEDGQQYGMTSKRNIETIPNHAMWIRQDWLDKFGMETPETIDALISFMEKVRDEDPDGNGAKDTYGLGFNYNYTGITKALFGEPGDSLLLEGDKFVDWAATDGYENYLGFLAKVYQEGLVDPEYITDEQFTRQRQLLVTGKTGVYMGSWNMETEWRELKENVPEANWVPLLPVETEQGRNGLFQEPPAFKMIVMNKDAKNPKAVMAYMDWMISEGWYTLAYGVEGENYNLVDGIPQVIDPVKNDAELKYAGEYAIVDQNQITPEWFAIRAAQDEISQAYVPVKEKANEVALELPFRRDIPYMKADEKWSKFTSDTTAQITTYETDIITGAISLEDGVKKIRDYRSENGIDEIVQEKYDWYSENKDLMQ